MPEKLQSAGFTSTLDAAAAAARMLADAGLVDPPTESDLEVASTIAKAVAAAPGRVPASALYDRTPASLLMVQSILEEFGHKVVQEAAHLRHLVTNKLVIETENPDPRVRMRALELLGKMGDVSLFTEKKEVTITHQTSDEVRERLRARLARLIPAGDEVPETPFGGEPAFTNEVEDAILADDPEDEDEDELFELSLEPRLANRSLFDPGGMGASASGTLGSRSLFDE